MWLGRMLKTRQGIFRGKKSVRCGSRKARVGLWEMFQVYASVTVRVMIGQAQCFAADKRFGCLQAPGDRGTTSD